MGREDARQYWEEQLTEYWESGFSIPEYCELKELSYESARRWVRIFVEFRCAVTRFGASSAVGKLSVV